MKLYWLNLGEMQLDQNYMVEGTTRGTVDQHHAVSKWCKAPIECAYIDHPKGKVIIDAGVNQTALAASPRNPYFAAKDQSIEPQLELCGVTPEEIDYVIVTHMHIDHIGELDKFKNAKVIVQRKELEQALITTHQNRDVSSRGAYVREDVDVEADFVLVDGDYLLFDDLSLLHLPGHTDGLQGVMLKMQDQTWIFASDAIFTSRSFGPPATAPAKAPWDSKAWRASVEKVRKLADSTDAKVIFGHDEEQFATLKKAPYYYE